MGHATAAYFDKLNRTQEFPLLRKVVGTIRFDLHTHGRTQHWYLAIRSGRLRVTREYREADTVIHADLDFFDRLVRGEAKPLPAWLRNELRVEGRFRFLILLERFLPGPPHARDSAARPGAS